MNLWESRWQSDRIGFHLKEVNPYLIRFSDKLLHQNPDRVFVPLCGKTLDLCWLTKKRIKVTKNIKSWCKFIIPSITGVAAS